MRRKSILEMSHEEAKEFFLKDKSYCNIDLPEYFSFAKLLGKISKAVDKVSDKAVKIIANEVLKQMEELLRKILFD